MRVWRFLFVLGLLLATASGRGAELDSIESPEDFDRFLHYYYREPKPALVNDAIRYLSKSGALEKKNAIPSLTGFFAEVFWQNPSLLKAWVGVVREQDDTTRRVLNVAGGLNPREDFAKYPPSSRLNDMYWGAFFGSGRTEYLNHILDHLQHIEERVDIKLFLAAASAKWSLASNAESHDLVRMTIESRSTAATKANKQVLEDILTRSPAEIRIETTATLVAQHEAGIW